MQCLVPPSSRVQTIPLFLILSPAERSLSSWELGAGMIRQPLGLSEWDDLNINQMIRSLTPSGNYMYIHIFSNDDHFKRPPTIYILSNFIQWNYSQIWKIFSAIEWKLFFLSDPISFHGQYPNEIENIFHGLCPIFNIKRRAFDLNRGKICYNATYHSSLNISFVYFPSIQSFPGQTLSILWYVWTWSFVWLMSANAGHYIIEIESHFKILPP